MIYIANDHAGYKFKLKLIKYLQKNKIEYTDLGANSEESVDFPNYCDKLAKEIKKDKTSKGILICGTGIGMSICANRYPYIRGALCYNTAVTKLARQHNDANVIIFGARFMCSYKAIKMLKIFLNTSCLDGKYARRRDLIDNIKA